MQAFSTESDQAASLILQVQSSLASSFCIFYFPFFPSSFYSFCLFFSSFPFCCHDHHHHQVQYNIHLHMIHAHEMLHHQLLLPIVEKIYELKLEIILLKNFILHYFPHCQCLSFYDLKREKIIKFLIYG